MKKKKHIIIVDDVTTNLKCVGEILRDDYSLSMAKSGEQAIAMIEKSKPDLILLDIKMPGMDGFETLECIRNNPENIDIPVIFLTADNDNESELRCLKLGASDFIKKPFEPEIMLSRIERILMQEEKNKSIRMEALTDPLTGLWNRKYIMEQVNSFTTRENVTGSFIILDLDNFKGINDTYGHVVGDEALIAFAKTLTSFVHKDDIVARIGGDEFAIFLKNSYGKELLSERIAGLIKDVETALNVIKINENISSVSVGISAFPFDGRSFIELYNNADKALYYVKNNGKNNFHFYDSGEKYSIADNMNTEVLDLSHLKDVISDKDLDNGPFRVEVSDFKAIYHFLQRYVKRTEGKVQIVLFTIKDLSLSVKTDDLPEGMAVLESCIKNSLRKNDVSSRYSGSQYVVILMDVDDVNRTIVIDRIMDNWNKSNQNHNFFLKYDIEEIASK